MSIKEEIKSRLMRINAFNLIKDIYIIKLLLNYFSLLKNVRVRRKINRLEKKLGRNSEIFYWKKAEIVKLSLYTFCKVRALNILKIFRELNGEINLSLGEKVIEIGTGPVGGVLDFISAEERWGIEPIYSEYIKNKILIIRESTAEHNVNVPLNNFNSAFAINSIDHGDNIKLCLININRVLKNNGLLFLHVHCRKLEQTNILHKQNLDINELKVCILKSGFEIVRYNFYEEDPISSTYNTFIGILKKF